MYNDKLVYMHIYFSIILVDNWAKYINVYCQRLIVQSLQEMNKQYVLYCIVLYCIVLCVACKAVNQCTLLF